MTYVWFDNTAATAGGDITFVGASGGRIEASIDAVTAQAYVPSGVQQNDIMILLTAAFDGISGPAVPATPSGWTLSRSLVGSVIGAAVFYKRAGASESNFSWDPLISGDGDTIEGWVYAVSYAFRGCITSGSPIDADTALAEEAPGSNTITGDSITTTVKSKILLGVLSAPDYLKSSSASGSIDTIAVDVAVEGGHLGYSLSEPDAGTQSAPVMTFDATFTQGPISYTFSLKPD